jgi:hypothetical protein
MTAADVDRLTREEAINGLVSKHNPVELRRLKRQHPSANLGGYWEPGLWALPAGAVHVYFIGSWRLITLAMLREALRRQVLTLTDRCTRGWVDMPLDATHKLVALRRRASPAVRLFSAPSIRRAVPRLVSASRATRLFSRPTFRRAIPRLAPSFRRAVPRLAPRRAASKRAGAPAGRACVAAALPLNAVMLSTMIANAATERRGDFVPSRVVLVCGNLSPGAAERQVAYTARGLAQSAAIAGVEVICDMLIGARPALYDFYLPLLQRAGLPARMIERYASSRAMVSEPAALAQRQASLPEGFLRMSPISIRSWSACGRRSSMPGSTGATRVRASRPHWRVCRASCCPAAISIRPHFALYRPYMDSVYAALCTLPNVVFLTIAGPVPRATPNGCD